MQRRVPSFPTMATGRPRDPRKRRITSSVAAGYAEVCNGTWYTRIGGRRQSTYLRDTPANEPHVRKILEERSLDYALRKAGRLPAAAAPGRVTVYELHDEYIRVKGPVVPYRSLAVLRLAVRDYFPQNAWVDYESLYQQITQTLFRTKFSPQTTRHRLQQLRLLFRFAVDRGYLEREPVNVIGIPKAARKAENLIYSHEEVDAIVGYLEGAGKHQPALLFRLLSLTAMRIGEALKLRWSDVDAEGIRIMGKGERRRNFPLAPFPEVRQVLSELEAYRDHNRGKLFPWSQSTTPQTYLAEAKKALRFPAGDLRRIHTLRATAEHWWKTERGLSVETCCKLSGHSIAVHLAHYSATPTAEELAVEVARVSYSQPKSGENGGHPEASTRKKKPRKQPITSE